MSYLSFLLCFVIAPALLLAVGLHWSARREAGAGLWLRRHWGGTAILALIALAWTTPWDNAIIAKGVWSYGADRVLGTIGLVPLEEYGFMLAMPFFNAAVLGFFLLRRPPAPSSWRRQQPRARRKALLIYAGLWLAGLACLPFDGAFYLSAILIWFIPPLALQAAFDPAALVRNRRLIAVGTLLPTLYFSAVDALAIRSGIWELHAATRTGLEIGNLPLEEALFFFTTSLLLAQGLLLWHTLFQRADA